MYTTDIGPSALRNPEQRSALAQIHHRTPYWLIAAIILGIVFAVIIATDATYQVIFDAVRAGIGITIRVSLLAYGLSLLLGLLVALARLSGNRLVSETATFYVEIIRGMPMLVLLYIIVFAGTPGVVAGINAVGGWLLSLGLAGATGFGQRLAGLNVRDVDFTSRVILALTIGYSAFLSEVFRAGIQSIGKGQTEAARALGMSYWQTLRFIILPQAIRRVLPPLGNNFISMIKDSSLVSVMGVADITFQGKVYAASTFRFFETYNVVAYLYLIMTITLTLGLRALERRMRRGEE
ncbi:MAG: amino acid ABC transporter permease [Caldilineae bacterium]|nr:MAG: amino acid ABC transporter permease [Caldilineae bacterium]